MLRYDYFSNTFCIEFRSQEFWHWIVAVVEGSTAVKSNENGILFNTQGMQPGAINPRPWGCTIRYIVVGCNTDPICISFSGGEGCVCVKFYNYFIYTST